MTQSPADGPVPEQPGSQRPDASITPYGELYAPAVHGVAADWPAGRAGEALAYGQASKPRRRVPAWLWAAAPALAGAGLGVLWWLLAPGGLNLASGNPSLADSGNTDSWLPRDLTLAGLFLLAGSVMGVLLDSDWREDGVGRRIILATVGSAVGAVVAWGAGTAVGQWWGAPVGPSAIPGTSFSLRALAVLLVWPGSAAVSVFVLTLLGIIRGREAADGPLVGSAETPGGRP